ncbi:MAG TPA: ABC transporter permease [Fimbriimonadaceae bacterium]|nr:ABC transporter permease [Fimbriimonadaceae bacterium]
MTERPVVRIEPPSRGLPSLGLVELWEYRELLFFLTWRDIRVRYQQTVLGAAWAILQPLFTMIVFTIFFGALGNMPSDGVPYALFSYTALVPWTFFAAGLTQSSQSVVGRADLIKKVYFPRLAIPISTVLGCAVDLALAFVVLLGLMAYYRVVPTTAMLLMPLFVALSFIVALGVGLWLAALNVQYRDVRYVVPFLTQFWMFATPIAYPTSLLPGHWRTLYGLNPMAGVVDGFRWAMIGTGTPAPITWFVSAVMGLAILISGTYYFRRTEHTFADVA